MEKDCILHTVCLNKIDIFLKELAFANDPFWYSHSGNKLSRITVFGHFCKIELSRFCRNFSKSRKFLTRKFLALTLIAPGYFWVVMPWGTTPPPPPPKIKSWQEHTFGMKLGTFILCYAKWQSFFADVIRNFWKCRKNNKICKKFQFFFKYQ